MRLLLVGLLAATLIGCGAEKPVNKHSSAVIVDKDYSPANTAHGSGSGVCTGIGIGGNGSIGTVTGVCFGTVTHVIPESWALIVKDCNPECEVWAVEVTPEAWAGWKTGDTVTFP